MATMTTLLDVVEGVRSGSVDAKATAKLVVPDADGRKVTVSANGLPAGDVRDPETWAEAAFRGVSLGGKAGVRGCEAAAVPIKVTGFHGADASAFVRRLLGSVSPPPPAGADKPKNRVKDHANGTAAGVS